MRVRESVEKKVALAFHLNTFR